MANNKSALIVPEGTTTRTGIMRARDVEFMLRGKVDPTLLDVLCKIAEINHVNMKAISEQATMLDQMVDMLQNFTDVAHNMKDRTDQMARAMGQSLDDDEGDGGKAN